MKRRIISLAVTLALVLSSIFCFSAVPALADDSGNCGASSTTFGAATDKAKYTYNAAKKTLTITGTGATKDYGDTRLNQRPWDSYKAEITTVVVGEVLLK